MNKATFLEMMDKYLDGTLPESELKEFKLLLKNDPLLQEELNIQRHIRNGIILQGRKLMAKDLSKIKADIDNEVGYYDSQTIRYQKEIHIEENNKTESNLIITNGKETGNVSTTKKMTKWLLASAAIFIIIGSSIIVFKYNISSSLTESYIGSYAVKVYPKEGNLGATGSIIYHIKQFQSALNIYEFRNDTIILFTKTSMLDLKENKQTEIILNEKRDLIIETENEKQIFKPKK